jgi:predicted enzyme related to lactoylglutathione lyase
MFQGLRTATYHAPDLEKAKAWYSQVLGIAPYFSEPFYVGFNVGGYELGLQPDPEAALRGLGGAVPYWGVEDVAAAHARLLSLGAEPLTPPQDVGGGIKVAVVKDPFGNALGIIENPHFKLPG